MPIDSVDTGLQTFELMQLFAGVADLATDELFVSGGFSESCERGLTPFAVSSKVHGTSEEHEYHHAAIRHPNVDAITVVSVLFK